MAELMLGQPLFPGESGIDQLVEIIKILGTPTREQIRTMNPNYMEHKFPQIKPHPFHKVGSRLVTCSYMMRGSSDHFELTRSLLCLAGLPPSPERCRRSDLAAPRVHADAATVGGRGTCASVL